MTRRLRLISLSVAAGCALLLPACETRDRVPRPPSVQTAPAASGPGLDAMYGDWETDKAVQLRSRPSNGAPIVASLPPGVPVKVMGRARGTDWAAVQAAGSVSYVRMHLLRLRGSAVQTTKGTTTTVAKPTDNAGPSIKAAPRRRIEAAPIAN